MSLYEDLSPFDDVEQPFMTRGKIGGPCKLSHTQCHEARAAYDDGSTIAVLAAIYSVAPQTIVRAIKSVGGVMRRAQDIMRPVVTRPATLEDLRPGDEVKNGHSGAWARVVRVEVDSVTGRAIRIMVQARKGAAVARKHKWWRASSITMAEVHR